MSSKPPIYNQPLTTRNPSVYQHFFGDFRLATHGPLGQNIDNHL